MTRLEHWRTQIHGFLRYKGAGFRAVPRQTCGFQRLEYEMKIIQRQESEAHGGETWRKLVLSGSRNRHQEPSWAGNMVNIKLLNLTIMLPSGYTHIPCIFPIQWEAKGATGT